MNKKSKPVSQGKRGRKENKFELTKPVKDLNYYIKILEDNNISCIFYIPGLGSGTIAKDKNDLLILTDLAKSKIEFLDLETKREARKIYDDLNKNRESKEIKQTVNYVG